MIEQTPKWYYKVAYFFIANQVAIKRGSIVFLVVINMIFWGYGIFRWTNYLTEIGRYNAVINMDETQNPNNNYARLKDCVRLEAVGVTAKSVTSSVNVDEEGRYTYDFLAKVINPNQNCLIKNIKYYFAYDGQGEQNQLMRQDFLLPGQTKYLLSFGEKAVAATNPVLIILEQELVPIENKKIQTDFEKVGYSDVKYEEGNETSQVSFKAINGSGNDFWQAGFQVVAFSDETKQDPLGIGYTTVNALLANSDNQKASVTWFKPLNVISAYFDIIPDLNVYGENVLMKRDYGPGNPPGLEVPARNY